MKQINKKKTLCDILIIFQKVRKKEQTDWKYLDKRPKRFRKMRQKEKKISKLSSYRWEFQVFSFVEMSKRNIVSRDLANE